MEQEGQTSSPAGGQIRPPPLSQHLREFAANPQAWAALGRNLIPVVGIHAFGWSAALSVFSYWFDGLTALAAIVAAVVLRLLREMPTNVGWQSSGIGAKAGKIVTGVVTWIFLVGVVALPYWIVLIPLHDMLLGHELRGELANSPALWLTFGALAVGHFWKAFQSGYDVMPEDQLKQRVRWDVYLLVLRAGAMFIMAAQGLSFILVPLMALLLTYMEVWPERVLGAVFGDPSHLWEYDPDKKTKR
ncbi:MAG TPA: hypothetical protein VNP98_18450 [Chthoniobacterales bacterium]|nr:hypothetical protein [Chthoniobacterales bacterium]